MKTKMKWSRPSGPQKLQRAIGKDGHEISIYRKPSGFWVASIEITEPGSLIQGFDGRDDKHPTAAAARRAAEQHAKER